MTKRSLLTSVVASAVLVGVLGMSGCGGSNSSTVDNGPSSQIIDNVTVSEGTAQIKSGSVVEIPLEGSTADGKTVQTAKVKLMKGMDGCTEATPCEVVAKQQSATLLDSVTKDEASALATKVPTSAPADSDVLFAGSLDINDKHSIRTFGEESQYGNIGSDCEMEVTVKLPAKAIGLDGKERNIWNCDIMQIHVQAGANYETNYWVQGEMIVEDHQGCGVPDKYVTFKVKGGLPAHILIFAVTDKSDRASVNDSVATGMTGSTGAGGY